MTLWKTDALTTVQVQSTIVREGSFAGRFFIDAGGKAAYAAKSVQPLNTMVVPFSVYFDAVPVNNFERITFLMVRDSLNTTILTVFIEKFTDGFLVRVFNTVTGEIYSSSFMAISPGTWIDFVLTATPTDVGLDMNGSPIVSFTGTVFTGLSLTSIWIGNLWSSFPTSVYIDAFCIGTLDTIQSTLTYLSDPIPVDATVNTVVVPPGGSVLVDAGMPVTVVVPSQIGTYQFDRWEDGSTSAIRVISISVDTAITAFYVKLKRTVILESSPVLTTFTVDGQSLASGSLLEVDDGTVINVKVQERVG